MAKGTQRDPEMDENGRESVPACSFAADRSRSQAKPCERIAGELFETFQRPRRQTGASPFPSKSFVDRVWLFQSVSVAKADIFHHE